MSYLKQSFLDKLEMEHLEGNLISQALKETYLKKGTKVFCKELKGYSTKLIDQTLN